MLVFPSPSLSLDPLFSFVCPVGVTWCCCVNPCPFKVLVLPSRKMPLSMYLCTLSVLGSTTVTTLLGFAITVRIKRTQEEKRQFACRSKTLHPTRDSQSQIGGGEIIKGKLSRLVEAGTIPTRESFQVLSLCDNLLVTCHFFLCCHSSTRQHASPTFPRSPIPLLSVYPLL